MLEGAQTPAQTPAPTPYLLILYITTIRGRQIRQIQMSQILSILKVIMAQEFASRPPFTRQHLANDHDLKATPSRPYSKASLQCSKGQEIHQVDRLALHVPSTQITCVTQTSPTLFLFQSTTINNITRYIIVTLRLGRQVFPRAEGMSSQLLPDGHQMKALAPAQGIRAVIIFTRMFITPFCISIVN